MAMEKRKKVIIGITGNIISDQRIIRIANTLTEEGFMVTVYYRHFFKFKAVESNARFPFETKAINSMFKTGILFYLWYNILLFARLLFVKTDYLYAVDSDTLPSFTLLSLLKGRPLLFDSHEYFSEVPELLHSPMKKKIWDLVTRLGVKRSSACITVGPELAGVLEKKYGKPFTSIRNVPVYKQVRDVEKPARPVILYQGALNAGRELEMLIDTMKLTPEFDCILAGEGDLSKALRERAEGYANISFAGLLSPQALADLTLKCFAGYNLLVPESLSYYYSLSNKYFDYMHAGVPSISSRLPEYLALNSTYGCGVCISNISEELALTLRTWLDDQSHYRKLKENAIIAAGKMNWENERQLLINLFKTI
jgi:glycosyltransferase involved in cell wall biosynthesis